MAHLPIEEETGGERDIKVSSIEYVKSPCPD
jgi:hypothetical protein